MAVDLSSISYIVPIFAFLIVFVVAFAVLKKTEIFKDKFFQVFTSLLIASVFVTSLGAVKYVSYIVPWFAVLLVSLFFILVFSGFIGKDSWPSNKLAGKIFAFALLIVFIIAGIVVLTSYVNIYPYLPGSSGYGGDSVLLAFTDWLYSPRVIGVIILAVAAALVSWILVKDKK